MKLNYTAINPIVYLSLILSLVLATSAKPEDVPSWSFQLEGPVISRGKTYHIVDLHDCHSFDLGRLRTVGTKPIAYVSSQFEEWRPDAKQFRKEDLGNTLWGNDFWVNPHSNAIRQIMTKRINLAKQRGFYGVIFENVSFSKNDTGFDNSKETVLEYIQFLSQTCHAVGLKFVLKEAHEYISDLGDAVDLYVVENGLTKNSELYANIKKPILNIEFEEPGEKPAPFPNAYSLLKQGGTLNENEVVLSKNVIPHFPTREDPKSIVSWSIQYEGNIKLRRKDYHVVDLFEVSNTDLARLRSQGTKTIAYFSSQYESWRPDVQDFPAKDIGKKLDNWEGERWINPRSKPIRELMLKRMNLAKKRGFYGIDVDNVDFYHFETGFDNSRELALEYIRFFVREAKARGLKFSLKNATDLAYQLRHEVDFYQNEEGIEYKELYKYMGVGKPVFNIEYQRPKKGVFFPGIYSIYKSDYEMDGREEILYPFSN